MSTDFTTLTDKQLSVVLGLHRVNSEMRSIRGPEQIDALATRIGVSVRSAKAVLASLNKLGVVTVKDDRYKLSADAKAFAKSLIKGESVVTATQPVTPMRETSHAHCTHPRTRAARAQCRKERAERAARGDDNGGPRAA